MTIRFRAVLFDLDGTLVDSAPDLVGAANRLRAARSLDPLPLAALRPWASHGARGLIGAALGVTPADAAYPALQIEFLDDYASRLAADSCVFPQMDAVLAHLESCGIAWGVVTNKAARFAVPLMAALGLGARAGVLVAGDTLPQSKPHPAPLLHAAECLGIAPGDCVYVGDDERDIVAGRAAGMATIAAAYGYCSEIDPALWAPDLIINSPMELITALTRL